MTTPKTPPDSDRPVRPKLDRTEPNRQWSNQYPGTDIDSSRFIPSPTTIDALAANTTDLAYRLGENISQASQDLLQVGRRAASNNSATNGADSESPQASNTDQWNRVQDTGTLIAEAMSLWAGALGRFFDPTLYAPTTPPAAHGPNPSPSTSRPTEPSPAAAPQIEPTKPLSLTLGVRVSPSVKLSISIEALDPRGRLRTTDLLCTTEAGGRIPAVQIGSADTDEIATPVLAITSDQAPGKYRAPIIEEDTNRRVGELTVWIGSAQ